MMLASNIHSVFWFEVQSFRDREHLHCFLKCFFTSPESVLSLSPIKEKIGDFPISYMSTLFWLFWFRLDKDTVEN